MKCQQAEDNEICNECYHKNEHEENPNCAKGIYCSLAHELGINFKEPCK